ncbi:NCS2 family permease [Lactobacillus sp. YT155]|uniref:NCS2 family permease n=1 Tax=Lactobacillus sp. YT155 TaxID=3060955 RepID=UPI00265FCCA7|nr:NCS2 family permease [Lactobacillus sp. YT155]MDO1605333.1 NCS2 family permease [Lactobacillus sp. YT155]
MKTTTESGFSNNVDNFFEISKNNSTIKTEVTAGITTFASMAYILFVNPTILGQAGMDKGAVFTATIISSIIGCFLMAFYANYPIAIAPGMGDNAFFTFSVVLVMGIPWQTAMAGVLIASILFLLISVFKIREIVIDAIPNDLKLAMAAGIGIFVAFVGLQGGGLIVSDKSSLVAMGPLTVPSTWLTIIGLFIIGFLMAKKVPGAIFLGMILTTILGLITKIIPLPSKIISFAPSMDNTFAVSIRHLGDISSPQLWSVVLIFLLVAFFDTAGTLIGLAQQAGFIKNNKMPRIGKALMADSVSMVSGAILGTTPTAAYVESSTGIAVGGKTGLTSFVTGLLFFVSLIFSPLLEIITSQVTAPILIIVGVLMASSLKDIHWEKFEIALPAFLTVICMPLTYNISYGIAFGFIIYPLTMIASGKAKKVSPVMYGLFFVFVLLLYVINVLPK